MSKEQTGTTVFKPEQLTSQQRSFQKDLDKRLRELGFTEDEGKQFFSFLLNLTDAIHWNPTVTAEAFKILKQNNLYGRNLGYDNLVAILHQIPYAPEVNNAIDEYWKYHLTMKVPGTYIKYRQQILETITTLLSQSDLLSIELWVQDLQLLPI